MADDPLIGSVFQIQLSPRWFGSEHSNHILAAHNGSKCTLIAEIRTGLYQTSLSADGPNTDFVHEGKLLVMPSKDGKVIALSGKQTERIRRR